MMYWKLLKHFFKKQERGAIMMTFEQIKEKQRLLKELLSDGIITKKQYDKDVKYLNKEADKTLKALLG